MTYLREKGKGREGERRGRWGRGEVGKESIEIGEEGREERGKEEWREIE